MRAARRASAWALALLLLLPVAALVEPCGCADEDCPPACPLACCGSGSSLLTAVPALQPANGSLSCAAAAAEPRPAAPPGRGVFHVPKPPAPRAPVV